MSIKTFHLLSWVFCFALAHGQTFAQAQAPILKMRADGPDAVALRM